MRERTEVLVVGAGPVGLVTALILAEAGIEAEIIDHEQRTTSRSYACALHPGTLRLLERLGLAAELVAQGRQIQTVAFYEGEQRHAEVRLAELGGSFPFVLILPQSALEEALEKRLRQKAGRTVNWHHRFDSFQSEEETIVATIEKLEGTGTGYIVPHWEMMVKQRFAVQAQFVIGADGHNSLVRQRLKSEYEKFAGPDFFAAYEFEPETTSEAEVRVVLDGTTTNVLWPLPGNKCRWTFQLSKTELAPEFPEKDRRAVRLAQKAIDERIRQYVQKVARQRAPWFTANVKEITWCTEVAFEQRLAKPFGHDRCWLVGDAAHQTGPVGAQSMNVGFLEAESIAAILEKTLHRAGSPDLLRAWDQQWQEQWLGLLGARGGLSARTETSGWVRERRSRILACLPASGQDLRNLAGQLALDLA
jgi:2-polyprenyl-6-methoxyphenol hydroxylase-like FAD-dependent oxidoreductase